MSGLRATLIRVAVATIGLGLDLHFFQALGMFFVYIAYICFEVMLLLGRLVAHTLPQEAPLGTGLRRPATIPTQLKRLTDGLAEEVLPDTDVYSRLRPILREAAQGRLAAGHGILLDQQRAAARAILSPELWDLLRSDPPLPRAKRAWKMRELRDLVEGVANI